MGQIPSLTEIGFQFGQKNKIQLNIMFKKLVKQIEAQKKSFKEMDKDTSDKHRQKVA